MKTQAELQTKLREIDHKGYKAYKVLEGEYDFGAYRLCIDHVQGDPFAPLRGFESYIGIREIFPPPILKTNTAESQWRIICSAVCTAPCEAETAEPQKAPEKAGW